MHLIVNVELTLILNSEMKKNLIVLLTVFWISIPLFSQENRELGTDDEKASYIFGVAFAREFPVLDRKVDIDLIMQGMGDKLEAKELLSWGDTESTKEKESYDIGISLVNDFKSSQLDRNIKVDWMSRGIKDKLENKELLFPEDSFASFMKSYNKKLSEKRIEENKKIFAENRKKPGIKETASGLQYKVEKKGRGKKPTNNDIVSINYVMKNLDGRIITDSKKTFKNKRVSIRLTPLVTDGLYEGLKLMSRGAKYTFYIPSDLAYGEYGPTGRDQALIFDVELVDFKPFSPDYSESEDEYYLDKDIDYDQVNKNLPSVGEIK